MSAALGPGAGPMPPPAAGPSSIFISYASADRDRVLVVADALEARGIPVWVDRRSIAGGQSWSTEIVRGIKGCAVLIVACSPNSVSSRNVRQEVQLAWESDRPILPLLLDKVAIPEELQYAMAGRQWVEIGESPEGTWLPDLLVALAHLGFEAGKTAASPSRLMAQPEPPAPPAAAPGAETLPTYVASFIGREEFMRRIPEEVTRSRLYTITGAGGVGKSRLAVEVGRAVAGALPVGSPFSGGVWYTDLGSVTEADLVASAVSGTMGLREEPGRSPLASLVEHLRGRKLLLILDNCEHLVGAAADLVSNLLKSCPDLHVLATSREVLGAPGEKVLNLVPLYAPFPDRLPSLDKLAGYGAVVLFVDRAQAVAPDFRLDAGNARAVAEICHALDGIPLAIELAAARARVLSPEQIAGRLDDRFRLLRGSSRGALPRQQTLQALVDWSYDLLSPKEAALWRRLSVFRGGFTLEAAETVCAGGEAPPGGAPAGAAAAAEVEDFEVLDLLTSLVEKSLVLAGQGEREARYRLFETLRRYGEDKLREAGEEEQYVSRHTEWCLTFLAGVVATGDVEYAGGEPLDKAEAEYENLRIALARGLERRQSETVLKLADGLWPLWTWRLEAEGHRWLETVLARTDSGPSPERARALTHAAAMAWSRSDLETSSARCAEALAMASQLGLPLCLASVNLVLGNVEGNRGDFAKAVVHYEETARIYRAEKVSPRRMVSALNNLAVACWGLGQNGRARETLEEVVAQARAAGDARGQSIALVNLADLARYAEGDLPRAERLAREGLAAAEEATSPRYVNMAGGMIGLILLDTGRAEEGLRLLRQVFGDHLAARQLTDLEDRAGALVEMAFTEGRLELTARLVGFHETLPDYGLHGEPTRRIAAELEAKLGHEVFEAARQEGRKMTVEQAAKAVLEAE